MEQAGAGARPNEVIQFDKQFKVIIIGDEGVGKTNFIKQYTTGEFEKRHVPTQGVDISQFTFQTNYGPIKLHFWDIAGKEQKGGLKEVYYVQADAAIMMFDVTVKRTYQNIGKWYKSLTKTIQNIPSVLVGNKIDSRERKVKTNKVNFHRLHGLKYYEISVKMSYQTDNPFLGILRELIHSSLVLQETAPLQKPVAISQEEADQLCNLKQKFQKMPSFDQKQEKQENKKK